MLTPSDLKTLRRLLDKAGSETEFQQAVKRAQDLPKRGRGRPAYNDDFPQLIFIELLCRSYARHGIKRNTALKSLIYPAGDGLIGKTGEAAVRRIAKRLRDKKFKKQFTDETIHAVAEACSRSPFGQLILRLKRDLDGEPGVMPEQHKCFVRKAARKVYYR